MTQRETLWTMIDELTLRTKIVAVDIDRPERELLSLAAERMRAGAVIVAPTDTRYALVARADSAEVLARVYEIKGRARGAPFAIFVSRVSEIWKYGERNDAADRLAEEFLPGPLTLVLRATEFAHNELPQALIARNKIGVRVSGSDLLCKLAEELGQPLTATSANRSGAAQAETAQEIAEEFSGEVRLVLDGGTLAGKVSSVVDCSSSGAVMLRAGEITQAQVDQVSRA